MIARLGHWRTTAAGLASTGVLVALFRSFQCELPADWLVWAAATAPAVLGALAKDS